MWIRILIKGGLMLIVLCAKLNSQNLIYNPSFEEYTNIPNTLSFISYCKGWKEAKIFTTPDYYHSYSPWYAPLCADYSTYKGSVSIPKNCVGFQYPKEGLAYVGMIITKTYFDYSEPIYSLLLDTLLKDHFYEFNGYFSLAEASPYVANQLQVFFTDTVPILDYPNYIISGFQIEHDTTVMMTDTFNWQPIRGCFKAKGGERYIAIGNFRPRSMVNLMINNNRDTSHTQPYLMVTVGGYYYLDDLSLYDRGYYGEDAKAIPPATICPSSTIIIGQNDTTDAHYQWWPASSLSCDTCPNPVASPTVTTTYVVKKWICSYVTYDTTTIYVPEFRPVRLIPDTQVCYPVPSFKLSYGGDSTGYVSYQWTSSQWLSCSDCAYPLLNVSDTGQYMLFFTQEFCNKVFKDSVWINVKDCSEEIEYIPNIFTPNGDGVNDEWFVRWNYSEEVENFWVQIYDRWGVRMLESRDRYFRWDGKVKSSISTINGERSIENDCPTGVYYYVMEWERNGKRREVKGYVTLLR